jgi:hypothetical protein
VVECMIRNIGLVKRAKVWCSRVHYKAMSSKTEIIQCGQV